MRGPSSSLNCYVAVMELYMFYCIYVFWNYVSLSTYFWRKIDVFEFEFEFELVWSLSLPIMLEEELP